MIHTLVIISQALLYGSFSLLVGYFLLKSLSEDKRPVLNNPRQLIIGGIISIPILTFIPLLPVAQFLSIQNGWLQSFTIIFTSYQMGFVWIVIFLISLELLLFYLLIKRNPSKKLYFIAFLQVILLIAAVAWTSHAVSLNPTIGFIGDFIHLTFASIWVGTVLCISFLSTTYKNWTTFLKWYSPTALISFLLIALSGLVLTDIIVPNYFVGFSTTYGQGLIIKHLFILPLLFYIFINGILIKRRLKVETFDPRPWARLEAIILLFIFITTAIFSQYNPPSLAINENNLAPLFQSIYPGEIANGMIASFQWPIEGTVFTLITIIALLFILIAFQKKAPISLAFSLGVVAVISSYFAFMTFIFYK